MKFTVSKDEMQHKLSDIQSIVEKKTTMPILSHFLMDVTGKRGILYATDLETAIRNTVDILNVEQEGAFCISAKKLYEISREVTSDMIFESDDSEWIKIKSGNSNFRIACLNTSDYPQWPVIDDKKSVVINSKALLSMIEKTILCAGENDTRYTLNGLLIHIIGDKNRFVVVGTDGHRLASVFTDMDLTFDDELKIIVPRKSAMELRKILTNIDDEIKFDITKNHVLFNFQNKEFLTKLIEGSYPNYDQVIPQGNDKIMLLNRVEFMNTLRRVSVMSRERSHAVRFDIKDKELLISSADPEIGEANDRISIDYQGDESTFGFNARYILDVLESMELPDVVFELFDTVSPTLLKEKDNDNYKCVVMPMRI